MKTSIDSLVTTNIIGFFDALAQAMANVATGQSSILGFFQAVGLAFLDMIAKTLQGIAMLILQMIVLDAVEKLTGIPVRGLLGLFGGQGPMVGVLHSGGVAGEPGGRRRSGFNLSDMFEQYPRYHTGGIAGLAPDEVNTILRKGEEVLTEDDPRHRFNGGLAPTAPSAPSGIRQVLVIGDDEIAGAMTSSAGEQVVMTHLRRNRTSIKQMLDQA